MTGIQGFPDRDLFLNQGFDTEKKQHCMEILLRLSFKPLFIFHVKGGARILLNGVVYNVY